MALSRRNILIGLGAAVGGGGALVSTGAFTTVSAQRTVDVQTAGDASAFLQITADDEYVPANSDGGTLTIDLAGGGSSGFNQNAVTTIDGVVSITNNAADGSSALVGVSTTAPGSDPSANGSASLLLTDQNGNNVAVVTFYVSPDDSSISSGSTQTVQSGNSVELDVEVDTTDSTLNNTSATTGGLTIVATESA
ncbi:hypothetical protein [Halobaculum sp. EA56]|uniref:hypothetical protein n=1 Tax=Halobaculum sp. EA56 TaxID=3421648 RepID=UPI003EB70157